ncbi:MAG: type II secretion system F family protein [Candidatus Omnitrophica bacterium CG07_land_8_20_14_0_80_42_15]|uniref:Type II secretion system F family protein n=1 Tax=Candidatus Aquitaenariimonas noxiae TaxID=1974741 RepID=A0A2J0KSV3_9BACT|nr:MAG: type II secretion system F family protein [Candidatus Omnitrophica bacterium CG07_land_8_20_14_0_80_42_15]
MAIFEYKARDKFGKQAIGIIEADNAELAGSKLKQMNYVPISIKEKIREIGLDKFIMRFKRVRFSDLNMFTMQLVTLQKSGLPLLTSLSAIRDQSSSDILKATIESIIKDIEAGSHFSDALAKHPRVFNGLYVSMVKAGEVSGTLDEILSRLAILGEHEEETRAKIMTATRYPLMVVTALLVAFMILTTFIIPRFASLFSQFNVELPLPTRVLIGIHYAIINFWWLILTVIGAFVFGFSRFVKTEIGRFWWDGLKLKIPVFGPLFTKITMSRFARITGTLTKSGVPILQILDLVSRSIGNVVIARAINIIKVSVNEGKGMSEPMKMCGMFPPIVVQMVASGEATGKVDELLLYVSDYYDSQTDHTVKNLTTLIEPVLILALGCGVLFMALGIFLPMWNMMSLFK